MDPPGESFYFEPYPASQDMKSLSKSRMQIIRSNRNQKIQVLWWTSWILGAATRKRWWGLYFLSSIVCSSLRIYWTFASPFGNSFESPSQWWRSMRKRVLLVWNAHTYLTFKNIAYSVVRFVLRMLTQNTLINDKVCKITGEAKTFRIYHRGM